MKDSHQILLRVLAPILLFGGGMMSAADFEWDGGHGGQNRFTDKNNWNPNTAPPNDGSADLIFTGFTRLTPETNGNFNANSVLFNGSAGAFTITGGLLTLQGSGVTYAIDNQTVETQSFSATLALGGSQTWNAGTADLSFSNTIALGANNLTLTGAQNFTISGALSGTGGLAKSGSGIATLSGANTYSGGTTVSAGELIGSTTSLQGNILNNATLTFAQGSAGTYSGIISGTGDFQKTGAGTLSLTGFNSFSGTTSVQGGALQLGSTAGGGAASTFLSDATIVDLSASTTFAVNGYAETIGNLTGSGAVTLGTSGRLSIGADDGDATFSGNISGAGGITKVGTGTLTLTGTNSYTDTTQVSAGTLVGDTDSLTADTAITSGAQLTFDQAGSGTYSSNLSGAGNFVKDGAGNLTLSGANSHTGATTVGAGDLTLDSDTALNANTDVTVASGANLALGSNLSSGATVGSLAGEGGLAMNGETLTVGQNDTSTTFSGAITGGASSQLVKDGTGTFTLSGDNSGYSGGITISDGTLRGDATSLTVDLTNNAVVDFNQGTDATYAAVISGSGDFTKSGAGVLTFSDQQTYSGTTSVTAGGLRLGIDDALDSGTDLTLDSGVTFELNGYSQQVGTLSFGDAVLDFGSTTGTNYFLFGDDGTASGTLTVTNWEEGMDAVAFVSGTSVLDDFIGSLYFSGIGSGTRGATGQTVSGYGGTWDFIIADNTPFQTWDGGGSDNNWSTAANWTSGVPANADTTKAELDGSTRATVSLDTSTTLNALRFAETADAFTVDSGSGGGPTGRTFTFDGNVPSIIQLSAEDQTINTSIFLEKTVVMDVSGAGELILNGNLLEGSGGTTGGINKLGVNTLVLAGDNDFEGTFTIAEGIVRLESDTALGTADAGTTVSAGAELQLTGGITIANEALALDGTLTDLSGNNAYNGAISGSGALEKSGAGTLTLGGTTANTFTGASTVSDGVLLLNKTAGVDALAGEITVSGDGVLQLAEDNQIADSSRVTMDTGASPTFDLDGAAETIGSLSSANTNAIVDLGGNTGALTTGGDDSSTTYAGSITGSGSLTKVGTGTFELSGDSDFSGDTTVSAGTLVASNSNALGTTGGDTTIASGATLQVDGGVTIAESITIGGTLGDLSGSNTLSGVLSGSGTLDKSGSGDLTLSGSSANTFAGTTNISDGTLNLAKTSGDALAGTVNVGPGTLALGSSNQLADSTTVNLTSGSAVFNVNGASETIGELVSAQSGASVTLGSGSLTTGGNGGDVTFAGVISGTGDFTKAGTGTLTLTNNNTYTGTTTVSGGVLEAGISYSLADTSSLMLSNSGTFSLAGAFSQTVDDFSFSDGILNFGSEGSANDFLFSTSGTQAGSLTIRNWTESEDFFGIINTGSGSLDQAFLDNVFFDGIGVGIGAVIDSMDSVSYSGGTYYRIIPIPTFVWDGQKDGGGGPSNINWSHGNNWEGDIAPATSADQAVVFAGSTRTAPNMDGAYEVRSMLFEAGASAFTLNSSTTDTLTVNGGGIYNNDDDLQTINLDVRLGASQTWNAFAGDLAFTNSSITTPTSAPATLTVTGGFDTTISSTIGVDGNTALSGITLLKQGDGTLTLESDNYYTGNTTVSGGTLSIETSNALGTTAGNTTVSSGGTLQLNGTGLTIAENLSLNGAGFESTGALLNASGTNSISGTVALAEDSTVTVASSTSLSITGLLSGSDTLTKDGAGLLAVSNGSNTFSGDLSIYDGTLQLGAAGALGSTPSVTIADVAGATLDLNDFDLTIGSLSGGGGAGGTVDLGSAQLTAGSGNTTSTFDGAIVGTGDVVKTGTGTLTLGGSSTYSGDTTVNAGTLSITSAAALGTTAGGTTVTSGATLEVDGTGLTIAESLDLSGSGASGAGALRNTGGSNTVSGSITLSSDSTVAVDDSTALSVSGGIGGTGGLTLDGGGTLTLGGDNTYTGDTTITDGTLQIGSGSGHAITGGTVLIETGGTLLLDGTGRIESDVNLVLGGGTLALNGNSLDLGSLTLTADSVIDFGGGPATLDFTGGATTGWTGTLTIVNWDGSVDGGGDSQLFFSGGLGETELGKIVFADPSSPGPGDYPGNQLESGEVVPTPEPATWTAGLLLTLVAGWRGRCLWKRQRESSAD